MLFNSIEYIVFLPIVLLLFWRSPQRWRVPLLVVASYFFYMCWKPLYGLLLLFLTVVNFAYGVGLASAKFSERVRRCLLFVAISTNLLALAYFKYAYMGWDIFRWAARMATGINFLPLCVFHSVLLPLGISFFVFEFIHYLVDVYKGHKPVRSFLDFALFASFFPTQIAGPIKRFQDFMPQLHGQRSWEQKSFDEGVELILFGLFKKVLLADNLAFVSQAVFSHATTLGTADLWLGLYCFAFQIYFDFSGYTDIARGSALLFGYKVPLNFDLPYLAGSISEFWRRWHISLSSWLRDYVFISLGGSRQGAWRCYRNLFLTMLIGGLWHGAAWHFVFWGAYHGLLLVVHKLWVNLRSRSSWLTVLSDSAAYRVFATFLTFHVVCIGWVLFRAPNLATARVFLCKILCISSAHQNCWLPSLPNTRYEAVFAVLPVLVPVLIVAQLACARMRESHGIMPWRPARKAVYLTVLICVLLGMAPDSTPRFIYFQF